MSGRRPGRAEPTNSPDTRRDARAIAGPHWDHRPEETNPTRARLRSRQPQMSASRRSLDTAGQKILDHLVVSWMYHDLFLNSPSPGNWKNSPFGNVVRPGGALETIETELPGVLLFTPAPHRDERGMFSRTFDADVVRAAGIDPCSFVQDSLSRSVKGVIRGLHLRSGDGEAKIVRCSAGAIFDVVVDLRPQSPTFRRWTAFDLTGESQRSIYIPAGCAHGFQALTDIADISYRIDRAHDPSEDVAIAWNDPELAIPWPNAVTAMSPRDIAAPSLAAVLSELGL